ncbi:RING/FYVE/PHD-type zinc finger family protein [Thalictrum thalictroides]|uniref:RING/FYVE/PHD-type zinc finger family protein n=1 Tax=Thalictrum thalictroides TaxID=46969 RepID=A0A7J6X9E1_THATH|nr:RING/FYVE/PHD-type zinc finger family protein [Thalictrum thalictroides]
MLRLKSNLLGLLFQATWKISWTKYKDSCIDLKSSNYSQIDRLVSAPATLNSISHGIWSFQGCGKFSILTGQNKCQIDVNGTQDCSTNVSFLVSGKNGDSLLHPSVYIPSAPPLLEPHGYHPYKEVLEAEPPEWLPDSSTSACMQCTSPFTALTREYCDMQDFIDQQAVHPKLAPAAPSAVEALKTKQYCDEENSKDPCTICREEFMTGEDVTLMPCSHIFHKDCIECWLKTTNTCPLCRFAMPTT